MGHTTGRSLTFEVLEKIAKKYKSRGEFLTRDSSAYQTARNAGYLNDITRHMRSIAFSIPQLVCRDILDSLLNKRSLYNTRKVVPPYEVDIYYPELLLAVEYHGKGWHTSSDVIERDFKKSLLLKEKGVFLLSIIENNRNYEDDIKKQMGENVAFLEKFHLTKEQVFNTRVHWDNIYSKTTVAARVDEIKLKVANCSTLKEFRTLFPKDYGFVRVYGLRNLIAHLPKQKEEYTKEELRDKCLEYKEYSKFVNTKIYHVCHKRGFLKEFSKHMFRNFVDWRFMSDEEVISMFRKGGYVYAGDVKNGNPGLYNQMKKRKLRVWSKVRKTKYDPQQVKKEIESLRSNLTWADIKRSHAGTYGAYVNYKRKGCYG